MTYGPENQTFSTRLISAMVASTLFAMSFVHPAQAKTEHQSSEPQKFSLQALARPILDKLARLFSPPPDSDPQGIIGEPCGYANDFPSQFSHEGDVAPMCEVAKLDGKPILNINFDGQGNPSDVLTAFIEGSSKVILASTSSADIQSTTFLNRFQGVLTSTQAGYLQRMFEQNEPIDLGIPGRTVLVLPVHDGTQSRQFQIVMEHAVVDNQDCIKFPDGSFVRIDAFMAQAIQQAGSSTTINNRNVVLSIPPGILVQFPATI